MARRVILGTIDLTLSFCRTPIHSLEDIHHILPISLHEIHLVVITGSEIAHYMFVSEEEHDCEGFFVGI